MGSSISMLILLLQLISTTMIAKGSRFLRTQVVLPYLLPPFFSTAAKKLRDTDELSIKQMEELLGRSLQPAPQDAVPKQTAQKPEQKSIKENDSMYFYGLLPLKSQSYPECVDPDQIIIEQTPNQNIFKALSLPDNCSFDQYALALNKFRTSMDLYGEQEENQVIENDSLEFKKLLDPQSEYLIRARKYHMVNISIPGTIECEDPRNFMELRPIQQFRHTPLVPISESYMQKHKEMLERYHRKQFVFEVSTEKIVNWVLILACLGVAGYMINLILQREEERTVNFTRLKHQRLLGESSEKPVFRI